MKIVELKFKPNKRKIDKTIKLTGQEFSRTLLIDEGSKKTT